MTLHLGSVRPSTSHADARRHQPSRRLAAIRADGLRLLTWSPRKPDALPEAVRRHVAVLERVEQQARDRKDLVALATIDARIRNLLRERVS